MAGRTPSTDGVSSRDNTAGLKPAWEKGKSGNPNGRPKRTMADGRSISEICRSHTIEAVQVWLDVMGDAEAPPAARVSAAGQIADRGWGKATQPISGDDERPPIEYVIWPVPAHRLEQPK